MAVCRYAIPTHWDIGKVYKRLIKQVAISEHIDVIDALMKVYSSFISPKIDDYNSSVYYEIHLIFMSAIRKIKCCKSRYLAHQV